MKMCLLAQTLKPRCGLLLFFLKTLLLQSVY